MGKFPEGKSKKLLIHGAEKIITLQKQNEYLENTDILIKNNVIEGFYESGEISLESVDEVINAEGCFVFPGLINTHHHFYQQLFRNIPEVQELDLFPWLKKLYPIWANLDRESVYYSALIAIGELLKSGCTMTTDLHYLFPENQKYLIDAEIRAAKQLGIRFHPCRGSMSLSKEEGGLPPKEVVQKEEEILADSERLIEKYHNDAPFSMCRIALAPCSPFSVTESLMKNTVQLARKYGVQCHTHLAETRDEEEFCLEKCNMRPLEYLESLDWVGEDIWFAHGIHFNEEEIKRLAETNTGIAHCPTSNQKLSSGNIRLPELLKEEVPLGLAVDGGATHNSNMIGELKNAYIYHRGLYKDEAPSAYRWLKIAVEGGSTILGRDKIGHIKKGNAADLFLANIEGIDFAGGLQDPVWALINCGISQVVDTTIVNGKVVVKDGKLMQIDERIINRRANNISKDLYKS